MVAGGYKLNVTSESYKEHVEGQIANVGGVPGYFLVADISGNKRR